MKFTIKLPTTLKKMTVAELLTTEWLVPKKQRHLLRTKQHVLINDDVAKFSDLVSGGDQITVLFDTTDFPDKKLVFGDKQLGESLILYEDDHSSLLINQNI